MTIKQTLSLPFAFSIVWDLMPSDLFLSYFIEVDLYVSCCLHNVCKYWWIHMVANVLETFIPSLCLVFLDCDELSIYILIWFGTVSPFRGSLNV